MTPLAEDLRRLVADRRVVVVGVGNPIRGDDGIGSRIARDLAARGVPDVIDAEAVPESYLGRIIDRRPEVALFVDAAELGEAPGTLCLMPLDRSSPAGSSTHAPSLGLLGRILRTEGIEAWLAGIQPGPVEIGAEPGPEVTATAATFVEGVLQARASGETSHV